MMEVLDRLGRLGLNLPPVPKPVAVYVPAKRAGNLVWVSGQAATHRSEERRVG